MEVNQTVHVWPSPGLVHYVNLGGGGGSCSLTNSARCKIHFVSKSCVLLCTGSVTARHSIAIGVSQTLWRGTRNEITELSLLVIFNRGRHLYSDGGHHLGQRPTF